MPLPPPETIDVSQYRPAGSGYGHGDTHRLDPARIGNPLPETVRLLVDERAAAIGQRLTGVRNLDLVRTRLPVGDLCATHGDRALFVAVTTADELSDAIDDGRLARLVHGASRTRHPFCLMVEGGLYHSRRQPLARLAAAHSRLVYGAGVSVMETIDARHTAYMVVRCARDRLFPDEAHRRFEPHPPTVPPTDDRDAARHMLEAIPGVSPGRAASLLARFGSIAAIANADAARLSATDGIGAVTARRILSILAGTNVQKEVTEDTEWSCLERL